MFKKLAKKYGTPLYVYDRKVIEKQYNLLNNAITYSPRYIYYAIKANSNLYLLKELVKLGARLDASSPAELYLALKAGLKPSQVSFTGVNLSKKDLKYILKFNTLLNLDSLSQLELTGTLSPGRKVGLRINTIYGAGHHKRVVTAGKDSKFGISLQDINEAKKIAEKYNLKIIGLHHHIGSGILNIKNFIKPIDELLKIAGRLKNLEYIDFGGGLGVPYKPGDKKINIKLFGKILSKKFEDFSETYSLKLTLHIEPGRFLIAESGTLLVEVTAIKKNPAGNLIIGTNSGMTHLIRPALYGAYHEIGNVSNPHGKKQKVTLVGNICESSDIFAKNRHITKPREGDLLAIKNTGAYGFSMASRFNGRELPAEILINKNKIKLIRKEDSFKNFIPSV